MLIAGAGGFSKQLMPVVRQLGLDKDLLFFDQNPALKELFGCPIVHSEEEVKRYFQDVDHRFTLGVGKPHIRRKLTEWLLTLGGLPQTLLSPQACIVNTECIGPGTAVLAQAVVEEEAVLGRGVLVNLNALVCHETLVGDFVEISPGAMLLGACRIGDFTSIGAGAIINPLVSIGKHAVIGAGAVVINDVPDYTTAVGVPAKAIKTQTTSAL